MTLIASISGIRGTIGEPNAQNLSPDEIARFTCAFATLLKKNHLPPKVVIGRDARPTGEMVSQIVIGSLVAMGIEVIDLGLSTTPTVEIAVPMENAGGGIIITASHNPIEWNALKLLNEKGEFISEAQGQEILKIHKQGNFALAGPLEMGRIFPGHGYMEKHIEQILALPLVRKAAIEKRNLKVVVDAVNSTGGIFVPALLRALGVHSIIEINCNPTGLFAHNPEPLKEHLQQICAEVKSHKADLGIVVDPDVDRLVFVSEDGELFGEEYTLVSIADYVLKHTPGNTVSNMSSTRALRDVTENHKYEYHSSAVGEVHVVRKMKEVNAVIGGEGNGGIIYPEAHYGRDALVGIGLFLSHLAESGLTVSQLRATYPNYFMAKKKISLTADMDINFLLEEVELRYKDRKPQTIDGVKIDFDNAWVHLRRSNTEPIIRVYTEAPTQTEADKLGEDMVNLVLKIASANRD
jgi:phosphomannomutase